MSIHRSIVPMLLVPFATFLHAPAAAVCPGDFNIDKTVDLADLTILLGNFGMVGADFCDGDMNNDSVIDIVDLALFLPNFGLVCICWYDLDMDGAATILDLAIVVGNFGMAAPVKADGDLDGDGDIDGTDVDMMMCAIGHGC